MKECFKSAGRWLLRTITSVSVLYIAGSLLELLGAGVVVGLNYLTVGLCAFLGMPGVLLAYGMALFL